MLDNLKSPTRRQLLTMIGKTAGGAAMYQAMTTLGFASESSFKKELELSGAPAGASIIVLGAGLAGLTAAYELRKAGYKVTVLEYQNRGGGRSITLKGGDRYTELGGEEITCDFEEGNYFNPGPWLGAYRATTMQCFITAKSLGLRCSHLFNKTAAPTYIVPNILMGYRSDLVISNTIFKAMSLSYYQKRSMSVA